MIRAINGIQKIIISAIAFSDNHIIGKMDANLVNYIII